MIGNIIKVKINDIILRLGIRDKIIMCKSDMLQKAVINEASFTVYLCSEIDESDEFIDTSVKLVNPKDIIEIESYKY